MNFSTFVMILLIAEAANADSTVQTTNGPIRGKTVSSGKVEAFLGIPYAEPPVGRLRFAKPVPKSSWKDVYDAREAPPACIQSDFFNLIMFGITNTSEDCLYLNMWVPQSQDKSELKPVIIYIHGGAFMFGSSNQIFYDGASLAEHENVIVATINYRLGGLGFFTDFTDDAPGNMGMQDQVAAIRWIKENAEVFQGDPNNIVLMGGSAGSFSVSAHLVSPLSKDLFRRAILSSGTAFHPAYSNDNKKLSEQCQKYAGILGCTANSVTVDNNPESIVECMKNLPVEKFSEADTEIFTNLDKTPKDLYSLIFFPRVGDDFLPENPIDSFRKGNFKDTELFIGITKDEGSVLLSGFTPALFGKFGEQIETPFINETSAREFIKISISSEEESEDDKIIESYIDRVNEEEEHAYLKTVGDAIGDYLINCGAIFQADIQSLRSNPVYFYMFSFLSSSAIHPKWMGVPHGEDIQYVFGNFFLRKYTEMEKEFSRDLMDRLVAFAKTGNPNIPKSVTWPRYTFQDPKYLVIDKRDTVKTKPDHNRCKVWRKRFRSVIDDDLIQSLKNTEF